MPKSNDNEDSIIHTQRQSPSQNSSTEAQHSNAQVNTNKN